MVLRTALVILLCLVAGIAEARRGARGPSGGGGAPAAGTTTFAPLRIGAGGQLLDLDIAADGTKVVMTDTFGGWWYNPATTNCGNANRTGCWQQLVTGASMPASALNVLNSNGVYALRIAPSNTSHFYMYYAGDGCIYSTANHGQLWTLTAFTCTAALSNPSPIYTKFYGPHMAVDPANENVMWVGTPSNGVYVTQDGGASFSHVSTGTIPGGSTPAGAPQGGGNLIAFDTTSALSGGKTQGLYITSYGTGVYHSTNASAGSSATFSELNSAGMPTTHDHMIVDQNGVVWLTDDTTGAAAQGHLNKYASGAWSQPALGTGQETRSHSIAVNPGNANQVIIGIDSGDLIVSANGGSTWTAPSFNNTRTATDIPWLGWTTESYMTNGNQMFDPSTGHLDFAEGIGFWDTASPQASATAWTSISAAIEQLVTNTIVSPWIAGSKPVLMFWDRPAFYSAAAGTYPSTHGAANPLVNSIIIGWQVDWASSAPGTLAALASQNGANDESGISTDGGQTWTAFAALPTGVPNTTPGGSIAVASPTVMMWVLANDGGPYCTTNGGTTWTAPTIGSIAQHDQGWNHNAFFKKKNVAADRVNANTFYAYNDGTGAAGAGGVGIWKTTDSCSSFTRVNSTSLQNGQSAFNGKLKSVPGVANDLFYTPGTQGSPGRSNSPTAGALFYECTGSGAMTCTAVSNVLEVWDFGFGKAKPAGSGFPAIYIYGWVSNVLGVWRSDDHAVTWTQLSGPWPCNMDEVVAVEGDANTYGTVYVGMLGSGACYGHL